MINLIWAMDSNNLIGNNNKLPWHYKEDLAFFKQMTKNKTVLMGSKTYLSIISYLKKPLPNRKSIVLTRDLSNVEERLNKEGFDNVKFIDNLNDFLINNNDDIFVIGGKSIYEQTLKYADVLFITHIKKAYVGDTYINFIDYSKFNKIVLKDSEELLFAKYERKQ